MAKKIIFNGNEYGGGVDSVNGMTDNVVLGAGDVGAIPTTSMGVANGVATLDVNGVIPSAQLPSYVDQIDEYDTLSDFPATGESDKIYIAVDTHYIYRWSGTEYVQMNSAIDGVIPIQQGGTGATTAIAARTALQAQPKINTVYIRNDIDTSIVNVMESNTDAGVLRLNLTFDVRMPFSPSDSLDWDSTGRPAYYFNTIGSNLQWIFNFLDTVQLALNRTLVTDLSSQGTVIDAGEDTEIGVTGILSVGNGGTGTSTGISTQTQTALNAKVGSDGTIANIVSVASLPAVPDENTLYFVG